jgi:hypothetical protein
VWRGSLGRSLFSPVGPPFRLRVSHHLDHAPSPHPARRTVQADFPHTALGQDAPARGSRRRVSRRSVMASGTSEPLIGVRRLAPISRLSVSSAMGLELGSLPSAGVTRLPQYYEPLRHPKRPGLSLTGVRLSSRDSPSGASRVASDLLYRHAVAITPVGSLDLIASRGVTPNSPATTAFPVSVAGRLPHYPFRGLLSVHSRYGLSARGVAKTTLCIEGFGGLVTSTAAPIATGWSDQELPGGTCTR